MKTTLERIIKQTRSVLLEEARWQAKMHRSDMAKHLRSVAEHPPEEMLRSVADMVGTGDDLRGLAEREAQVEDGRPVDATGEPLEVGDLVRVEGELWVVAKIQRRAGQWQIIFDAEKWTWSLPEHWTWSLPGHCTKITTLTREEYLPLARRTMDPDLNKKERLAMLAMGLIGETNEFLNSYGEDEIEEAGDVLWYAEQLLDEVGPPGPNTLHYDTDDPALWEVVKKAVFHGVDVDILGALAVGAIEAVEEVVVNDHGVLLGEVRVENIKKLLRRYPEGFVEGGGVR